MRKAIIFASQNKLGHQDSVVLRICYANKCYAFYGKVMAVLQIKEGGNRHDFMLNEKKLCVLDLIIIEDNCNCFVAILVINTANKNAHYFKKSLQSHTKFEEMECYFRKLRRERFCPAATLEK